VPKLEITEQLTAAAERHVAERFEELAATWEAETRFLSSSTQIVLNPSYQQIIGLGPAALPHIFARLQQGVQNWSWALRAITGEDPTAPEDAGDVRATRDRWLRWAGEHGYR